jgi:hypothetical protein
MHGSHMTTDDITARAREIAAGLVEEVDGLYRCTPLTPLGRAVVAVIAEGTVGK